MTDNVDRWIESFMRDDPKRLDRYKGMSYEEKREHMEKVLKLIKKVMALFPCFDWKDFEAYVFKQHGVGREERE